MPARVVGAALEASSFHPGRTGLGHLEVYAAQCGASRARCRDLIEFVGLGAAAGRRVGGYSLGMRQRLGLATALLAEPPAIVLDEPANGLDPEGIVWMRGLLRAFAAEGRTVLISSHVLSEVQHTVDDVVILHERLAQSLDEIAAVYDLPLSALYAAMSYYHDHKDEIDRRIDEDDAYVEAQRLSAPSKLQARLKALRGG